MQIAGATVRIGLVLLWALVPGACSMPGSGYGEERERLEGARQLWRSQGWDSYAFTLRRQCYCEGGTDPVEVVVRNGTRVSVTDIATGQPVASEFAALYRTVPELFDFIEAAIDRKAHELEVSYDAAAGYPVRIRVDYIEKLADDEMGFAARDVRSMR